MNYEIANSSMKKNQQKPQNVAYGNAVECRWKSSRTCQTEAILLESMAILCNFQVNYK